MDYARSEVFQPKQKKVNLSEKISSYLDAFKNSMEEGKKFIMEILSPGQLLPPVVYDCLITLFNEKCSRYLSQYLEDATQLYQKLSDLIWYIPPHVGKFKLRGAEPSKFFELLIQFNDPTRSKRAVGKISKFILLSHLESITTLLAKSFVY